MNWHVIQITNHKVIFGWLEDGLCRQYAVLLIDIMTLKKKDLHLHNLHCKEWGKVAVLETFEIHKNHCKYLLISKPLFFFLTEFQLNFNY